MLLYRPANCLSAESAHIEMGRSTSPVHDGEDLVGCEQTERNHGSSHTEDCPGHNVRRVVKRQVHAGEAPGDQNRPRCPLPPRSQPTVGQQRIRHSDERDCQCRHRAGGERVALPSTDDPHPNGPRGSHKNGELERGDFDGQNADEECEQVPPTPEPEQSDQCPQSQHPDRPS